ncbi:MULTISPECIES: HNH endonuclease [unclassified Cupriavidus]|uniref:HNH endonuclease n=1 Tax=unclassified Cupriavidus TaxID=2640874 RepID=UPI00313ECCDC
MAVTYWIDDDAGYLAWREQNPDGYVAVIFKRTKKRQSTRHLKLHSVSHPLPDRSKPESVNPWTGNRYAKITSEVLSDLVHWLTSEGFDCRPDQYCMICGLGEDAGDGTTHDHPGILYPDEVDLDPRGLVEGAVKQVFVNQYERNSKARNACIRHWGTSCYVCRFDFLKSYGEMGRGFIHVHHLTELASVRQEYEVDPKKDLRPVCPNCHAMLHTRRPALDIEELRMQFRRSGKEVGS